MMLLRKKAREYDYQLCDVVPMTKVSILEIMVNRLHQYVIDLKIKNFRVERISSIYGDQIILISYKGTSLQKDLIESQWLKIKDVFKKFIS